MGMNDDGLTRRESTPRCATSSWRARSASVRPARAATASSRAALALVLVGAVSGAAIATAAIFGTQTTATTPTPSPVETATTTPVPTPSPTPTSVTSGGPAEAVLPFGGECESALTDAEATTAAGMPMALSDYRWRTGADEVLGGIDCIWLSTESYAAATVQGLRVSRWRSCRPRCPRPSCRAASTWRRNPDSPVLAWRASSTERGCSCAPTGDPRRHDGGRHPGGLRPRVGEPRRLPGRVARSANRGTGGHRSIAMPWWARSIRRSYGFERVALLDQQGSTSDGGAAPETIADAARSWCDFHFTAGSGDDTVGRSGRASTIVPGGAIAFPTAAATEACDRVHGRRRARCGDRSGHRPARGAGSVIVATDGVNVLMVTPDFIRETTDAGPIADAVFAQMHP